MVPSRHGTLNPSHTRPFALNVSRSCASGDRLTYRHSRSSVARWPAAIRQRQGCDSTPTQAGDVFVIETPGGGGYSH